MTMQSPPIDSDQLNAYLDGTLTPAERAAVEAAVAIDEDLAAELLELKATSRLLGDLPEFTPRRSFKLGPEHAHATSIETARPGKIVRLLPLVRTLSVAAMLVFMVVGGALFFDVNGDKSTNAPATFEQQNEIMSNTGETESHDGASQDAEDAPAAAAPADNGESSMTERGEAASVGETPLEDLAPAQDEGSNDVAQAGNEDSTTSVFSQPATGDHTSWKLISAVIGGFAVALAGIWFALAQVGRQSGVNRS